MDKKITPEDALQLYAYVIATKYEIDKYLDDLIKHMDKAGLNALAAEAAAKMVKENNNDTEQNCKHE